MALNTNAQCCEHSFPLKMLIWPRLWGAEMELTVITWPDLYCKHINRRRLSLQTVNPFLNLFLTVIPLRAFSLASLCRFGFEEDAFSICVLRENTKSVLSSLLALSKRLDCVTVFLLK